jgi:hypothetical protein
MEDLSPFWFGTLWFIAGIVAGSIIVIVGLALESIRRREEEEEGDYHFDPRKPWKRRK